MSNENETEVEAETTEAKKGRQIMIEDPVSGEQVTRTSWIQSVYQDDSEDNDYFGNRGAIAKKLTELEGRTVPYQIVFAATREMPEPAATRKERSKAAKEAAAATAKAEKEAAKPDAGEDAGESEE